MQVQLQLPKKVCMHGHVQVQLQVDYHSDTCRPQHSRDHISSQGTAGHTGSLSSLKQGRSLMYREFSVQKVFCTGKVYLTVKECTAL